MSRSFGLNNEEDKMLFEWLYKHDETCPLKHNQGAIGGRLTYCFTPTGLGDVIKVKCSCGEEIDLTIYEDW